MEYGKDGMNRAQRRALERSKGKSERVTIVEEDLNESGKDFILFAEENNVDMNAFFRMFSAWIHLSSSQKQAVIVECVKQGKINMEEEQNAEQNSES